MEIKYCQNDPMLYIDLNTNKSIHVSKEVKIKIGNKEFDVIVDITESGEPLGVEFVIQNMIDCIQGNM